jgi:hypothetical protein
MKLPGLTFGEGNSKVGEVLTFSLPSQITCPGMSVWCQKRCNINKLERLRPSCRKAYERNLLFAKNPKLFSEIVKLSLANDIPGIRIHVSGDFFCEEYIDSWVQICSAFPQTKFWAYTRSWTVPKLLTTLEKLRLISNVQLFGSTDPSMSLPPVNWRVAFVNKDMRASGLCCPQQEDRLSSCLKCGYCFRKEKGNVIFKVH